VIEEFARRHRLKTERDVHEEITIPGRNGHIYQYSGSELGVIFLTPANETPRTAFWNRMSTACILAGLIRRQRGDAEGAFSFNPANPAHVRLALKLADVRAKRRVSEVQRTAAAARFAKFRATKRSQPAIS
jgi:hypothetical protein